MDPKESTFFFEKYLDLCIVFIKPVLMVAGCRTKGLECSITDNSLEGGPVFFLITVGTEARQFTVKESRKVSSLLFNFQTGNV